MTNNRCPMCEEKLQTEKGYWVCLCGWQKAFPQKLNSNNHHDSRCHYQLMNERCPLPGSMSFNIRSNISYCELHWRTHNHPHLGEAALRNAQKNYMAIMQARRPWQDVLIEKFLNHQGNNKKKTIEEARKDENI